MYLFRTWWRKPLKVFKHLPQERVAELHGGAIRYRASSKDSGRTSFRSRCGANHPVAQIREPNVAVERAIPQERVQQHTEEQIARVHTSNQPDIQTEVSEDECVRTKDSNLLSKFRRNGTQSVLRGPADASAQDKPTGAQQERQQHRSQQQQTAQGEKEEEEGRKVEKRKGEEQLEEKEVEKETEEKEGKRERERRGREGSTRGRAKEKEDGKVDKVVMDAVIQIFVKADGTKTVPMVISSKASP